MKRSPVLTDDMLAVLRELVTKRGMSYQQVARQVMTNASTVHRWVSGATKTATIENWLRLRALCRREGLTSDSAETLSPTKHELEELRDKLRRLKVDTKDVAAAVHVDTAELEDWLAGKSPWPRVAWSAVHRHLRTVPDPHLKALDAVSIHPSPELQELLDALVQGSAGTTGNQRHGPLSGARRCMLVPVVDPSKLVGSAAPLTVTGDGNIQAVIDGAQHLAIKLTQDVSLPGLPIGAMVLFAEGKPVEGGIAMARIPTGPRKHTLVMGHYYTCRRTTGKFILTADGLEPLADADWVLVARQAILDLGSP